MGFNKQEVRIIKELGDAMGYGRIMQIASALWAIKLKDEHGLPESGAFIPTIDKFMIKKEAKRAVRDREWVIEEVRKLL